MAMDILPRSAEGRLKQLLAIFPAVALTGPRQSGKSTLLKTAFQAGRSYVNFDDPLIREDFNDDPRAFISRIRGGAIIDEAQKAPEIFEYLKMEIDSDRSYGRFILTGSSQFSFIRGVTESLAGRIGSLGLFLFEWKERRDYGTPQDAMLLGGYPELVLRDGRGAADWFSAYVETYVERDARSIREIGNLRDFARCVGLLAARTAQELNMSVVARDLGVSEKTVQSWISVLEASFILFLVPAWHRNYGKRIIKRPKLYFWDTGLASHLTGLRTWEALDKGPLAGPLFENWIASETLKSIAHAGSGKRLHWMRANGGLEIDFILEDIEGKRVTFIEVKRNESRKPAMCANLRRVLADHDGDSASRALEAEGLLVYRGASESLSERIRAVNYLEFVGTVARDAEKPTSRSSPELSG
jgi:predicted AAA+ superfamily ATPase